MIWIISYGMVHLQRTGLKSAGVIVTYSECIREACNRQFRKMANQERSDFYIVFPKIHCVLQLQTTLITLLLETAQVSNQSQGLTRAI